jgi:hypothetical protein
VLKEQTAVPTPKLGMLRAMEAGDIANYLSSHPGILFASCVAVPKWN